MIKQHDYVVLTTNLPDVRAAYGMKEEEDPLAFLLRLNVEIARKEAACETVTPPGLPAFILSSSDFTTPDCIQRPGNQEPKIQQHR